MTTAGFARILQRAAPAAGPDGLKVKPHMLRHACGYALANAGQDTRSIQAYLGHRHIGHTVRYTELAPDRFRNFWRDCARDPAPIRIARASLANSAPIG